MTRDKIRAKAGEILGRPVEPHEDLAASINEAILETEQIIKKAGRKPRVRKVAQAYADAAHEAEECRLGVVLAALRVLRHQQGLPPERRHASLYDHACFTLGRFLPDDEREQLARCYSQDGARGARKVVSGLLVRNSDRRLAVLRAKVAARG